VTSRPTTKAWEAGNWDLKQREVWNNLFMSMHDLGTPSLYPRLARACLASLLASLRSLLPLMQTHHERAAMQSSGKAPSASRGYTLDALSSVSQLNMLL
jgi:hypothetical protein